MISTQNLILIYFYL